MGGDGGVVETQAAGRATAEPALVGTFNEFENDVRAAVAVWRKVPWLPVVSAVLGGASVGGGPMEPTSPTIPAPGAAVALFIAGLLLGIFSIGWSGEQRLVYADIWDEHPTSFGHAIAHAFRYLGRFFRLGLIVVLPTVIATALLQLVMPLVAASAIVFTVQSVVLTFVTPALAYHTDSAVDALRRGWRLLRVQGRRAGWYAAGVPLILALATVRLALPTVLGWIVTVLVSLLYVAFVGATAAAYLRIVNASPDIPGE